MIAMYWQKLTRIPTAYFKRLAILIDPLMALNHIMEILKNIKLYYKNHS